MARVPTHDARGIRVPRQNIRMPTVDTGGSLVELGSSLMRRAANENIVKAEEQAIADQSGSDELQQREVGFFGAASDRAYNKAAQNVYGIRQRQRMEDRAFELGMEYDGQPDAFREAWETEREDFLSELPPEMFSGMNQNYTDLGQRQYQILRRERLRQERNEQMVVLGQEFQRLQSAATQDIEQNGELSDEMAARFDAFYETARESQVSASTMLSWQESAQKTELVSSVFHDYRQAQDKRAYYDSLLAEDGPLSDLPIEDRLFAQRRLSTFISEQNAARTQQIAVLRDRMRDALELERKGKPHRNSASILESAIQYPELAGLATDLALAVDNTEVLAERRFFNARALQQAIEGDRQAQAEAGGSTPSLENLETSTQQMLDDLQKAQKQQDVLSYANDQEVVSVDLVGVDGTLEDPDARTGAVEVARGLYGNGVLFYTQEEFDLFAKAFDDGSSLDRARLVQQLVKQTPRQELPSVLSQIADDKPVLALTTNMFAGSDPAQQQTALTILRGLEYVENNTSTLRLPDNYKSKIAERVVQFFPYDTDGRMTERFSDAVLGIAADNARTERRMEIRESDLRDAMSQVFGLKGPSDLWQAGTGTRPVTVVPFEFGMTREVMENHWAAITDEQLESMTNGVLPVDAVVPGLENQVDAERLREDGFPLYVGPGRYALAIRDDNAPSGFFLLQNPVTNQRVEFNWSDLKSQQSGNPPAPAQTETQAPDNSPAGRFPGQQSSAPSDDPVMTALIDIESGGDPEAVSNKGAMGRFQIMPNTAADPGFDVAPLATGRDVLAATPEEQQRFASDYLTALRGQFGEAGALAAYNAGPAAFQDFLDGNRSLPNETIEYLKRFRERGLLEQEITDLLNEASG